MHEVALMRGAVNTVLAQMEAAGATRVTSVTLALGASSHLTAEAARQHFAALASGTPADGAAVEIVWLPAVYQCFDCLHRFESAEPAEMMSCPLCGAVALEIAHQDACYPTTIEVVFDESANGKQPSSVAGVSLGPEVAAES